MHGTASSAARQAVPAGPPLAVWACGQRSLAAQLAGRYLPATATRRPFLTPALASQILDAFSRPGDLVADPIAGPGILLAEAAAAGRRCVGLVAGQADADLVHGNLAKALSPGQLRLAQLRQGDERHVGTNLDEHHGQVQLIATRLPGPGTSDTSALGPLRGLAYENALSQVLTGCTVLLRPGGSFAVVTVSPVSGGVLTDLPGLVVKAATRAGLSYTQHIIAITALIRDSQLMPWEPDGEHGPFGEVRAHEDVLVFTRPRPEVTR